MAAENAIALKPSSVENYHTAQNPKIIETTRSERGLNAARGACPSAPGGFSGVSRPDGGDQGRSEVGKIVRHRKLDARSNGAIS